MVVSMFDQQLLQFACKCGQVEPIVLSRLDNVSRVDLRRLREP